MPTTGSSRIAPRFFVLLGLGLLALCAGYAAVVLHSATWAEARQLDAIFPFYGWRIRWFSAAGLAGAWQGLAAGAGLLGGAAVALGASPGGQAEGAAWWGELRAVAAGLRGSVAARPAAPRRALGGLLAALTALRLGLSWPAITPEYDDVPSYELFASKSLLAVAAYYPVPNNHVLSNTVSWLFYRVHPGFWWTMRLPVVLAATAATAVLFAGLRRAGAGPRPAVLATGLFSLAQLSLYHAAVGRGYWLLVLLAGVVFFCTLALARATRHGRAAWTGLVGASILGLYAVPTFALVLASAFSWLAGRAWRPRSPCPPHLAPLLPMLGVAAAGSLLLYAPLLFVSGPAIFFGNGFVAPRPWGVFWAGLPRYVWETEGFLAGQMRVGGLLTLVVVAGALLLQRRTRQGQLPGRQAAPWQQLAPAALWFLALPYAVLAAQRVFAPSRTLFYKSFFSFLLLALAVEWLLRRPAKRFQRRLRPVLGVVAVLWAAYQLGSLWRDSRPLRRRNDAFHAAFAWLNQQPRGPLLVPESTQSLFVRMYLHAERPAQTWRIDAFPRPGTSYAYVLAFPNRHGFFQPRFPYPPVFHNEQVDIYRVAPAAAGWPPQSPPYWHLAH